MRLKVSNVCWKKFRRLKYVTETKNLFDIHNLTAYTPETLPHGTAGVYNGVIISRGRIDDTTCSTGKTLRQLCPDLIVGETYTLNFETTIPSSVGGQYESIHLRGSGNWWRRHRKIITESDLSAVVYIYAETDGAVYMTYNLQIELGSTATPYQPYGYLPLNRGKYIANKEPVQLLDKTKYRGTSTREGITFTNNGDGTWTVVGTAPDVPANKEYVSTSIIIWDLEFSKKHFIPGHKIVVAGGVSTDSAGRHAVVQWVWGWTGGYDAANSWERTVHTIKQYPEDKLLEYSNYIELRVYAGATVNFTFKPQFFDLTEMYGAGNEPTTVAQFKADYPNELYDYNPYNAITFR